jgi:hypothetical protein
LFDDQEEVVNPFFERAAEGSASALQSGQELVNLGPMAFLVKISCIWGEVLAEIYRSANRPDGARAATYETFYSKTQRQLSQWLADLPSDMVCTEENMSSSARSGHLGAFLTIHSLYHATMMKLNRYVQVDRLPHEQIMENLRQLDKHAREQLHMITRCKHELQLEEPLGTPFTGYTTSSACDILSAKVPRDKLPEVTKFLSLGLSVLETLQNHWHTCKKNKAWILRRIERLEKLEASRFVKHEDTTSSHSLITIECIPQPMEAPVCPVDDIAYSADQDIYREALASQLRPQDKHCEPGEASASRGALLPSSVLESDGEKKPKE